MRSDRGMTLIELLTVITIAAILTMIAVPSFTKIIALQQLKSAASNLQVALLTARSEGIKRNAQVSVVSATGNVDWSQGWKVSEVSSGTVISNYPPYAALGVNGPATGVVYQSSGRITASAGAFFKVTSSKIDDIRCVNITVTGVPSITSSGC